MHTAAGPRNNVAATAAACVTALRGKVLGESYDDDDSACLIGASGGSC
jgi:hypothetical protein